MNIQYEFLSLMDSGGPVMWVIFFVACIALALVVWEALRGRTLIKNARDDYHQLRSNNDYLPNANGNDSMSPVSQ